MQNAVCTVNRYIAPLLPKATEIILLVVLIPRILHFIFLGGALPQPPRDQPLYLDMAGSIEEGRGMSFSSDKAYVKNLLLTLNTHYASWPNSSDYVFGLTPVNTPTAVMEPGYPLLLALFFKLFGAVSGSVFTLNLLFSIVGALAIKTLVTAAYGGEAGFMAAVLWALYPPYIYYSSYAMSEMAHFSLLIVSISFVFSTARGKSNGFLAGLTTGLFFLLRATAIFIIPLQFLYLIWQKKWKSLLFLVLGFVLAVSPWVVRNWLSLGEPVLMPTKGALNLLSRNDPNVLASEGIFVPSDIPINRSDLLLYPSVDSIPDELARSEYLENAGKAYVISNPRLMLWLIGYRAKSFLSPGGDTLGARGKLAGLIFYPMFLFGVLGLWRQRYKPETLFLSALFLLYFAVHSLAHGGVRYRLPVDFIFLIGIALFSCCNRGKNA